jgi:hypothetical protein
MDIEGFYAQDERRRHSGELEFGRDWRDAGVRSEVSWVEDTGELYVMREPTAAVTGSGAGDLELVPMSEHQLGVEVLGVVVGHDAIGAVMSGWEDAMRRDDGIAWLRDRIEHAAEHTGDAPGAPSDTLSED